MDKVSLPKNHFRAILQCNIKVKHNLKTPPNIVNCHCTDFELEKYRLLPYVSTKPLFYFITQLPTTKKDGALCLVQDKINHQFQLTFYRNVYAKATKKKKYKKGLAAGCVPNTILSLVQLLESDPDEFFEGDYNWYLTGGSLDVMEVDGFHYTLHVAGKTMNVLHVAPYDHCTTDVPLKLTFDEPVLEVLADNDHVILRCKSYILLYKFSTNPLSLQLVLSCQSDAPFICARLRGSKELVCLDLEHNLRVVPLDTTQGSERELSLSEYFKGGRDRWGSLVILNKDRYCLVVNRSILIVVDLKCMTCLCTLNLKKMGFLMPCGDISGVLASKLEGDLIYLATVHDIIALQMLVSRGEKRREGRVTFKECIRWAHQFKSAPLVMKTVLLDSSTELLFTSSLVNNSTRVMLVTRELCFTEEEELEVADGEDEEEKMGFHSYHPPFKPLDMAKSFDWCHQQEALIETTYNFRPRVNLSTIGLGLVLTASSIDRRSVNLLTMNSMGDIYHQRLSPQPTNDESPEATMAQDEGGNFLREMERSRELLVQLEQRDTLLTVTGCHNLKELFIESVLCTPLETDGGEEAAALRKQRLQLVTRRAKWNRPLGKLRKYKDVLSQDMLAIWDVSDDDDDGDGGGAGAGDLVGDMEPADKVSAWLQSARMVSGIDDFSMEISGAAAGDNKFEMTEPDVALEDSEMLMETSGAPDVQQRDEEEQNEVEERKKATLVQKPSIKKQQPQKKKGRVLGF